MTILQRIEERTGKPVIDPDQMAVRMAHSIASTIVQSELFALRGIELNGCRFNVLRGMNGMIVDCYGHDHRPLIVTVEEEPAFKRVVICCYYTIESNPQTYKHKTELPIDCTPDQLAQAFESFRQSTFGMLIAYTKGEVYEPTAQPVEHATKNLC